MGALVTQQQSSAAQVSRVYYPGCRAYLQVVLDGFGDNAQDTDPIAIPVLVKTARIHKNSYRQADSYEIGFDAGDLPFDPRIVRAGAAEIYLYQKPDAGPGGRVISRKDPLIDPDPGGSRIRTALETLALEYGIVTSKDRFTYGNAPIIAGLFDRDQLELSDDGKWVTINGQDYTAHLASIQWKPNPDGTGRRIPTGKRLDLLIADLLDEADPTGRLTVEVRGIDPATLPIVGRGEVRASKRGITVEQQTTYWDVIYKMVIRYSYITFVDGLSVVISLPKVISDQAQSSIKRLVWGRNIEHLTLERELGKQQTPTIVVKGYDPIKREPITVEYPSGQLENKRQKHVSEVKIRGNKVRATTTQKFKAKQTTNNGKQTTTIRQRDEYEIVTVNGVSDRATLQQLAESRYHLLGKSERKVVARTRDLKDIHGSDMLKLSSGDAVTIEWDEFNRELLANPAIDLQAKAQHLVDRGYNRATALLVAQRYAQLQGLDRPLRVKEVSYSFDVDDGIELELELYDFIVVDGIRSEEGVPVQSSAQKHRDKLVNHDGKTIGWSQAQRAANIKGHSR